MLTERVSGNKQLSAIPLPTTSPPTLSSSVSIGVSYNLTVGKGTLCRHIGVSRKLYHGVVLAAAVDLLKVRTSAV